MRSRTALLMVANFFVALVFPTSHSSALVIWDESVDGPLSSSEGSPTTLPLLALGTNSVISTIGGANRDYFTISMSTNFPAPSLVAIRLASYVSTDPVAWIGIDSGSPWTAGDNASLMLAQQHFGTANVGSNLLGVATNSPLPNSSSYTFRVQQLGASASYQLDMVVVPEPQTCTLLLMAGAGGFGLLQWRRRS